MPIVDRKAKRVAVAMASRVRYRGMLSADVLIRDLAFTGFRAECAVEFVKGDRIYIDLPSFGLVPAKIAWRRDGMIGALFDSVIDIRHCVMKPGERSYFSPQRKGALTGR